MSQAKLERVLSQAKQKGYREQDGQWVTPDGTTLPPGVDPKPVQEAAVETVFQIGAEKSDEIHTNQEPVGSFVIWSIDGVTKPLVREGDPLEKNLERVYKQWASTLEDDVAAEAARQLRSEGYDIEV